MSPSLLWVIPTLTPAASSPSASRTARTKSPQRPNPNLQAKMKPSRPPSSLIVPPLHPSKKIASPLSLSRIPHHRPKNHRPNPSPCAAKAPPKPKSPIRNPIPASPPPPASPSPISPGATSSPPSTACVSCRRSARTKPIAICYSCNTNPPTSSRSP